MGLEALRELRDCVTAVLNSGKHAGLEAAKEEGLKTLTVYDLQVQMCECKRGYNLLARIQNARGKLVATVEGETSEKDEAGEAEAEDAKEQKKNDGEKQNEAGEAEQQEAEQANKKRRTEENTEAGEVTYHTHEEITAFLATHDESSTVAVEEDKKGGKAERGRRRAAAEDSRAGGRGCHRRRETRREEGRGKDD